MDFEVKCRNSAGRNPGLKPWLLRSMSTIDASIRSQEGHIYLLGGVTRCHFLATMQVLDCRSANALFGLAVLHIGDGLSIFHLHVQRVC